MQKTGSPGPWGRAHWLAHPPQLRQPRDSPSLETSLPRLQGCDSSPGHQGLRGIEMTFILCNLYWCIGDLQCCRVCLFVFVLGGQQHDPLMHRCVHVLFWVLFPYSWRRKWQPTPVFLPGESHGWRSLGGYSPRGRRESDTTERLHSLTHSLPYSLLCSVDLGSSLVFYKE